MLKTFCNECSRNRIMVHSIICSTSSSILYCTHDFIAVISFFFFFFFVWLTMSLYSYSFNYLPPPDRSTTSFGPEDIRARFPNFQNVDEMKEFIMRLFVLQFQINHSFVQIKFGASLFVVIVFNGILITIRRMYDKSFWVARLVKRPSGTIVVVSGKNILYFL